MGLADREIRQFLERFPFSSLPEICLRQKMILLLEQKVKAMKHDYLRRRFLPHPKQKKYYGLGKKFRRRALFGGNRCGKTVTGVSELSIHLTGEYPAWWDGYRFTRPIKAWCASTTKEKTINGLQEMLLGKPGDFGAGFLPLARLEGTDRMPNVPNGISRARIRWGDTEENSMLTFKSYEQSRKAFETERVDIILLDEEPPYDIYRECQMRTIGTADDPGGLILLTFTPLLGMTDVCLSFLQPETHDNDLPAGFEETQSQSAYIMTSWEDNPYLNKEEVAELIRDTPAHELEARRHGRPSLGSGKIYAIQEDRIIASPFPIPDSWLFGLSLDHGWDHPAAICQWARDPNSGVCYMVSAWKQNKTPIPEVASVLRQMGGDSFPVFADPSGKAERQEAGGLSIFDQYSDEGIPLIAADNAVEAGLQDFRQGLINGQLKIFAVDNTGAGPCAEFFDEMRLYHRNAKGKIVKVRDDIMDAARYGWRHRDEFSFKREREPMGFQYGTENWKTI